MSIGNAIQAAVNGYASGRQIRNSWEDRKLDRERQARLDKITDDENRRAEESHDANLETTGILNTARRQTIRQTDQDWADGQDLRSSLSAADEAAIAGMAQRQPQLVPAAVSTSGGGSVPQAQVVASAATAPALGAIRAADPAPPDALPQVAAPPQQRPAAVPAPAQQAPRAAIPDPRLSGPPPMPAPKTFSYEDWQAMSRAEREAADLPTSAIGGQMYFDRFSVGLGGTPPRKAGRAAQEAYEADQARQPQPAYVWGQDGSMGQDAARAAGIAGSAVGSVGNAGLNLAKRTAEAIANEAIDTVQSVNAPFQAISRYATGKDHIGAPDRVDLSGDGRGESLATPLAESWGAIRAGADKPSDKPAPAHAPAAAGVNASESAKAVSDSAAQVMDAVTESPSMKAATEAMPAASLGVSSVVPMSQQQRARAGKTYMESYRDNGAPLVIRSLMKQGRLEQAKQFEAWVKDSKAADGMEAWGRGMFAAMQGDADGAADAFMDAYNNSGYFDDGAEVVREQSGLIKNESGDVVGVTLAIKDLATGEVTVQTDSIDGFIQKAAWITSPEKAFEASQARLQAQQEALIQADEERRASAAKLIETNYTKTVELARDMYGKSQAATKDAREAAVLSGGQGAVPEPMTWDEAFAEAQRLMGAGGGPAPAAAPLPPVARRPGQ